MENNTQQSENINLPSLPHQIAPSINALTAALGIPREVLASDEEILYAWRDLPRELSAIPRELVGELIARMCVAVSTGLFDGAINYIWNATVIHLRQRIREFGLPVVAQILQKDFEEKNLLKLMDSELIELCLKLNLITEDGFFFLDQCRDTRNNFSAAHPTIGKINDREFTTFLNRCIRYALSDETSPRGVDIGGFIGALKTSRFNIDQKLAWTQRLSETHDAQRQLLFGMVHGIYCDPGVQELARLNSIDICYSFKDRFTSSMKSDLINKHSDYVAKGDTARHTASQKFFEKLGLLELLNETERHSLISNATQRLWVVHRGMNNFYNEPPFAERLEALSKQGQVPITAQEQYVHVVVECFIGNSYGYSWGAEPHYRSMIQNFSPREVSHMISLIKNNRISNCPRKKDALSLISIDTVPSSVMADYQQLMR